MPNLEEELRTQHMMWGTEARKDSERRLIQDAYRMPEMQKILFGSFDVMQDWYKREVKPNTGLFQVLKWDDQPSPTDAYRSHDYYTYRMNLVQLKADSPDQGRDFRRERFAVPVQITETDWAPNVALQFDTKMVGRHTTRGELTAIRPLVTLKVWGETQPYEGRDSSLSVKYSLLGFEKYGTGITIAGQLDDPERTLERVRNGLLLVTPNVLGHKEIIRGS